MRLDWSLAHLLNYLGTWSGVKRYRERYGRDPLPEVEAALGAAWGPAPVRTINWPVTLKTVRFDG
jgi:hypothetical protein